MEFDSLLGEFEFWCPCMQFHDKGYCMCDDPDNGLDRDL